jgi:hypothetical protein
MLQHLYLDIPAPGREIVAPIFFPMIDLPLADGTNQMSIEERRKTLCCRFAMIEGSGLELSLGGGEPAGGKLSECERLK